MTGTVMLGVLSVSPLTRLDDLLASSAAVGLDAAAEHGARRSLRTLVTDGYLGVLHFDGQRLTGVDVVARA